LFVADGIIEPFYEDAEAKLKEAVEGLTEKNAKHR